MNEQQSPWQAQQPQQQQTWPPLNQGWVASQTENTPRRQFKSPLLLPLPQGRQQDGQALWGQWKGTAGHTVPLLPVPRTGWASHKGPPYRPQPPSPLRTDEHISKKPIHERLLQLPAYPRSPLPLPSSRHFKRWPWLMLGIAALVLLLASIGVSRLASEGDTASQTATASQRSQSSQPAQQGTTQPASQTTAIPTQTHATNWMTTHTFTGHSEEKKTTTFIVGDTWKIIWICNPGTIFGGLGIMIVNVYSSDGTFQHGAINDTCKAGHTTGNSTEHQGGNIYLDITGGGNWTIQIQELK